MSAWPGIGLVLGLLGATFAFLHVYQQRWRPPAERVRKLFHLVGGAIGLALPWLFDSVWPVGLLGGVVLSGLLAIRCSARLRAGIGSVIHGVGRRSLGDLFFPVGVCLVFALAGGDRLRVAIAILPLMVADPAAALVGLRYGRHRYRVPGGDKSVEGSAAFFVVALGCAAIPLIGTGGGLPSLTAIIAFALMLTLVEALATQGSDNVLIPLAGVLAFDGWLIRFPTSPLALLE